MITRVWHGWTGKGHADDYERLLRGQIFPAIAAREVEGYRGIDLLRRDADDEVEFGTIMWFDSLDAVREFAGDDYEAAYVPTEARALLSRFDERSQHFAVRAQLRYGSASSAGQVGTSASVRPGIGAVIVNGSGKILLHKRVTSGGWAPPSGRVEAGESILRALHREIREETQTTVTVERLIGIYSEPDEQLVQYPQLTTHFVTTVFLCRHESGPLRGSGEGSEWRWCAPDDLPRPLLSYAERWIDDAFQDDLVIR